MTVTPLLLPLTSMSADLSSVFALLVNLESLALIAYPVHLAHFRAQWVQQSALFVQQALPSHATVPQAAPTVHLVPLVHSVWLVPYHAVPAHWAQPALLGPPVVRVTHL